MGTLLYIPKAIFYLLKRDYEFRGYVYDSCVVGPSRVYKESSNIHDKLVLLGSEQGLVECRTNS